MWDWIEYLGVATAVLGVVLAAYNRRSTWVSYTLSSVFYFFLFLHTNLYADAGLQVFFILTGIYALIKWATADASYKLSFAGFPYSIAALTISTTIGLALGWLLHHYTDASWPFLDAIACLLSIAGQWLMMKRKVEAWWIWILVECLYMYIYASKQLWPTAALYLFLCILAVKGAVNWARLARTHQYN